MSFVTHIIDRPSYTVKFLSDTDFAEYIIKEGVLYDEKEAIESKALLEEINPGRKYYLLLTGGGYFRITLKARRLCASKEYCTHLAAMGCYTTNISLRLLGELFIKINKPPMPTKLFHYREEAYAWLKELPK